MFANIGSVSRQFSQNWIKDGRYIVQLKSLTTGHTQLKGDQWKAVLEIIHVIEAPKPDSLGQGFPHQVGEEVIRIRNKSSMGCVPEFKTIMCVAYNITDAQVSLEHSRHATSPEQPLAGTFYDVTVTTTRTKAWTEHSAPGQHLFTRMDWNARVDEATIAAYRAQAQQNPQG